MRVIEAAEITKAVSQLCISANLALPKDLEDILKKSVKEETNQLGKSILQDLYQNVLAAKECNLPICQDTGMVVVFAQVGQEVYIKGDFTQAINNGVKEGYEKGYLRCSVVKDPFQRDNTNDNTPAIIHTSLVPGNKIHLQVAPKGFGSENMSRIKMFNPSASRKDIIEFIRETVVIAGSNPCPPIVLGVGIGGDFEMAAILAKKALCRPAHTQSQSTFYEELEQDILQAVNSTKIGPQGFGGDITALYVNVEAYPTHIAGLPVAVNMGCHVTRHRELTI